VLFRSQASFAIQGIGVAHASPCVYGCKDLNAINYSGAATCDDGSCVYTEPEVICGVGNSFTWDCDGLGSCFDPGTGNGQYTTLSACNSACNPVVSWDCENGVCVDPGDGTGEYLTELECQGQCEFTEEPTWDCGVGGVCEERYDGTGQYFSLSACNTACGVTPSECLWCSGAAGEIPGCCDENATWGSYDPAATCNDGSCDYPTIVYGCMDNGYMGQGWWDSSAAIGGGPNQGVPYSSFSYGPTYQGPYNLGTNPSCGYFGNTNNPGYFGACNYYAGANVDDGSCTYKPGCMDPAAANYDPAYDTSVLDPDFPGFCEYETVPLTCGNIFGVGMFEGCDDFLCLVNSDLGLPVYAGCANSTFASAMDLATYWANEITSAFNGVPTQNNPGANGYLDPSGTPIGAITALEMYALLYECCITNQ